MANFLTAQDNGVTLNRPRNRRVTHTGDVINNLPTAASLLINVLIAPDVLPAYFHFSPSYLITSGNSGTVTSINIDILPGTDLMVPTITSNLLLAHTFYLNNITQCFAAGQEPNSRLITELSYPIEIVDAAEGI
jgi:hypothetical protein